MNTLTINYRGHDITVDKDLYNKHKSVKLRALSTSDIDQYLLNESDKSQLKSKWPNVFPEEVLQHFSDTEIANHVNDYLKSEIHMLEMGF